MVNILKLNDLCYFFINYFNYNLFFLKELIFASLSTQTFSFKVKFLPVFMLWTFILVNINENPFASRLGVDIWFQGIYLGGWLIERKLLLKKLILQYITISNSRLSACHFSQSCYEQPCCHSCLSFFASLLLWWTLWPNTTAWGKALFPVPGYRVGKPEQKNKARSWRQELKHSPWKNAACSLILCSTICTYIYIHHTHCIVYMHLI